ncbi:unnamed protein product, partial [Oppiella nova]
MTLVLGSVLGEISQIYEWCLIGLIAAVLAYYHFTWKSALSYWKNRNISGPKPIPIYGNFLSPVLKARPDVEMEWYKKYGRLFGVFTFEKPGLTVADPELVKQILVKDFNAFRNRRTPVTRHSVFSKIMFSARDDDWKRVRAIASPTFTSGKMRKMYALINHCCKDFLNNLDKDVSNGMNEVELKQLMGAYTMDVIASCAFA